MEIKLRVGDKEKTFTKDFISGRMLRRTIEINKKTNLGDLDAAGLDMVADYIAETFGGQFTRDEVYDGLSSHELIPTFQYLMSAVVSKANTDAGGEPDPNVRARV
ncbi:hypothetical protein D3C81_309320 [compost metagenome]